MRRDDGDTRVHVSGKVTDRLPNSTVLKSIAEASEFFERGSLGYSATRRDGRYDGLELCCRNRHAEPLQVESIESSYFEDESRFPQGTVHFDCAMLMRSIHHE